MNRRWHAAQARALIAACDGLKVSADNCRVSPPQLSDYQNPNGEGFMPADVIADLEAYCGRPIYSRALVESRPEAALTRDLQTEAAEAVEKVVDLSRDIRLATSDGILTSGERDRLLRSLPAVRAELNDVESLLSADVIATG